MASILAANIPLPPHPLLAHRAYSPAYTDTLDAARRRFAISTAPLQQSLLTSVQLGQQPTFYVFSITDNTHLLTATDALDQLQIDGLTPLAPVAHSPLNHTPHQLLSHFLNALRTRLLSDIVAANSGLQRCKDGFLISNHQPSTATDWATGWEYKALSRPLIFCHIQLLPSNHSILIRPTLLPTPYLPLPSTLPLPPRTPILLLPYATPAYFLTTYSGPTSALIHHFTDSLQGLAQPPIDQNFIIGWISVENRHGEDKGITFIYPARLCLSYAPSLNRPLLDYSPDLPGPLQPSPKLHSATATPLTECPPAFPHRPTLLGSPTTELKAFRALTLSKTRNIRNTAAQVSSYVDHVAKDRERERERLKREREGHSPSLLHRTTPSTSTPAPAPPAISVHTPMLHPSVQPVLPAQNFYPSPPQADTSAAPIPGNTSPVLATYTQQQQASQPSVSFPVTNQAPPPLTASSSTSSYDPFGYLGMDGMDFGMDMGSFSMSMGMNLSGNSTTASGNNAQQSGYNDDNGRSMLGASSTMDFEDFTDDDFNFFDQPSVVPSAATNSVSVTSPPLFGEVNSSGPGPPQISHGHPTPNAHGPWPSNFPEGFTPRSVEHMDSVVPAELLPSSPSGYTPMEVPFTPNVHIEQQDSRSAICVDQNSSTGADGHRNFDAIPFAKYHRVADDKYGPLGKFGLPSPPPDDDIHIPKQSVSSSSSVTTAGIGKIKSPLGLVTRRSPPRNFEILASWRHRYNAMTDPRVGVVRKLIGVKRKHSSQGGRSEKDVPKSPWAMEHEEWKAHRPLVTNDRSIIETELSDDGEEEEDEDESQSEDDEISEISEEDTPVTSRPSTPPPSYLPLGATLLSTHFQHAHLLPLSKPLRPSGSLISATGTNGGLGLGVSSIQVASAPTPVSPAAGLGLSTEKWKALELVVNVLAKEAVENSVWSDTWLANNAFGSSVSNRKNSGFGFGEGRRLTEVWASDVRFVEKVFTNLEGVEGNLTLNDIFGADLVTTQTQPLQPLVTPKITVSKGDAIANISPTSLRFWDKLGLGPKNGGKNASAYVLFTDDSEHRQSEVENWLAVVRNGYTSKHFGTLTPGTGSFCVKDGLVPLRFDVSFRKLFSSFANSLINTSTSESIVLFLIIPITLMNLSSSLFRQILSTIKRSLKPLSSEDRIFIQLIPEHLINHIESSNPNPTSNPSSSLNSNPTSQLYITIYNRILSSISRPLSRTFTPDNTPLHTQISIQTPLFTLSRPIYGKVSYVRSVDASLDVMDRFMMLHVGWRISKCGKWLSVACCDQRGEAWDQGVWLLRSEQQDGDGDNGSCGGNSGGGVGGNGGNGMGGSGGGNMVSTPGSSSNIGMGAQDDENSNNMCGFGYIVRKIWEFVVRFARRADVEWRIIITKLGIMGESELAVWTEFVSLVVPTCGLGPVHVSIMCADPDSPWLFTKFNPDITATTINNASGGKTPQSQSNHNNRHTVFTDISSRTYAIFPKKTLPISIPPTQVDIGIGVPYVVDPSSSHNGMDNENVQSGDGDDSMNMGMGMSISPSEDVIMGNPLPSSSHTVTPNSPTSPLNSNSTTTSPMIQTPQNQTLSLNMNTTLNLNSNPDSNMNTNGGLYPHSVSLIPKSTTCLIRVPNSPPLTSISMLHIHLLYTYSYPSPSSRTSIVGTSNGNGNALDPKTVHADVTKNFYELSVLTQALWNMPIAEGGSGIGVGISGGGGCIDSSGGSFGDCSNGLGGRGFKSGVNPILPMHLAMVEVMGQITDMADGVEVE